MAKWTEEEKVLMDKYYPYVSTNDMIKMLNNKTYKAIEARATRIGLKKEKEAIAKIHSDCFNENRRVSDGRIRYDKNYVLICQKSHPKADRFGYVHMHRYVMEQHLGRYLNDNEYVTFKNGDRQDVSLENLELHENPHHKKGSKYALSKDINLEEFKRLYDSGTTGVEIRKKFGIAINTYYKILKSIKSDTINITDDIVTYKKSVKFTIGNMVDAWLNKGKSSGRSFIAEFWNYYKKVKQEGIIDLNEYEKITVEVLKDKGVKEGSLS